MHLSKKTAALLLLGAGLLAGSGIAAALELPDQASDTATEHVAEVEASDGASQSKAADHRQNGGDDEGEATTAGEDGDGGDGRPTDTHGYEVSQLATTTELEGREKGEAISALAKTNGDAVSSEHADDGDAAEATDAADGDGEHGKSAAARAEHGR